MDLLDTAQLGRSLTIMPRDGREKIALPANIYIPKIDKRCPQFSYCPTKTTITMLAQASGTLPAGRGRHFKNNVQQDAASDVVCVPLQTRRLHGTVVHVGYPALKFIQVARQHKGGGNAAQTCFI